MDKGELRAAFERAGILLPGAKLDQFFSEVDSNHDGVITFDEWRYPYSSLRACPTTDIIKRKFLLFIPANTPNLRTVLSYYSSTVTVNSEGDVHVSETFEGLGKHHFSRTLFGALFNIFKLPQPNPPPTPASTAIEQIGAKQVAAESKLLTFPWDPGDQYPQYEDIVEPDLFADYRHEKEARLTDLFPPVGYFVAGGISGAFSRTATAPLDRLKVYLIAQVGVKDDAINHAKSGAPVKAAKTATRPLVEATKTLWRMGGLRSLFAGQSSGWRKQ